MTCDTMTVSSAALGCDCGRDAELYFVPTARDADFAVGVLRARCPGCGREAEVREVGDLDEEFWLG